jgi:hypothetical protein
VAFDYLDILMDALESHGMHYQVATSVENIDVELPAATSLRPSWWGTLTGHPKAALRPTRPW